MYFILLYCIVSTKFIYKSLVFELFYCFSSTARLLYSSKMKMICSQKFIAELLLLLLSVM